MPRTVHMELLRPEEIRDEQKKHNIVFLPLGPLEWHGPAMPYGTDPLFASAVAEKTALKTGGLVMSTLWMGTERKREDEILRTKGFEDPLPYVKGMDV
ncbi:MAG: creatininase family protein, partial [Candidatus Cloacimonetes bacterium]|nr:creatininase family protein [Candidatus Cloacimonadota bacterium]